MAAPESLSDHLDSWASGSEGRAVAATVKALANAGKTISGLVMQGSLAGAVGAVVGSSSDGDAQKELDRLTNVQVIEALKGAPVACIASEELVEVMDTGKPDAPLSVAIDPLDGSSNIDTNVTIGTIFSILPRSSEHDGEPNSDFMQPGARQLAAGYIIYGPHTALVLTVGSGTHIFTLDSGDGTYKLTSKDVQVPSDTREFAINASNYRHWDERIRRYIDDCLEGEDGSRGKNFNTRWIASMVAECHRILMRGGIYLYPGDARKGYGEGRLRLIYEANPIAFLMEQAGGATTTGSMRMLDVLPTDIHQRVPLIFGSVQEVELLEQYVSEAASRSESSPLPNTQISRSALFRLSTLNGFRKFTATRRRVVTRLQRSWIRCCGECRTMCITSVRNSPRRISIFSGFRPSTHPIPSLPVGSRLPMS